MTWRTSRITIANTHLSESGGFKTSL